jgi:hypothetical protein
MLRQPVHNLVGARHPICSPLTKPSMALLERRFSSGF